VNPAYAVPANVESIIDGNTFIYAARLFKRFALAGLILTGWGPSWSRFNPMERKWAPACSLLNSLVVPATTPGYDVPPNKIPKGLMTESQHRALIQREENTLFNKAVKEIRSYLHGKPHDGYPFFAQGMAAETKPYPFNDMGMVRAFSKASKSKIVGSPALMAIRKEYTWALKHCTVMAHELHFLRCDSCCDHCKKSLKCEPLCFDADVEVSPSLLNRQQQHRQVPATTTPPCKCRGA